MYYCEVEGLNYIFCLCQARYIMDELKDKSNLEIDAYSWAVKASNYHPLQHNGYVLLLVLITAYIQCVIVYFFDSRKEII